MATFKSNSPFGGILGSNAALKVLDVLLSAPRLSYNIAELSRAAALSRTACDRVVKRLAEWRLLRVAEGHANITSYCLDETSQHVAALREFHLATLESLSEPQLGPVRDFEPPPESWSQTPISKGGHTGYYATFEHHRERPELSAHAERQGIGDPERESNHQVRVPARALAA